MERKIFYALLTALSFTAFSQKDSSLVIDSSKYVRFFKVENLDQVDELDFQQEDTIPKDFKKKKIKKRVYYGYKTKKAFIKSGYGEREVIEIFHYLKVYQEPNPYVNEIYWFDTRKMKIEESRKYDPTYSKILHGPYKKMMGGEIIEEGIFYIGTKHGRWVSFDKPKQHKFRDGDKDHYENIEGEKTLITGSDTLIEYQLLESKIKYNRGWPKNAQLKYYDVDKTLLKEVIPYDEHFKLTGEYFSYYQNGKIHWHGNYINGTKVGEWVEYHTVHNKVRRKTEILFPEFPQEKDPQGELQKQWNGNGEIIYDLKDKIDKREEHEKESNPK